MNAKLLSQLKINLTKRAYENFFGLYRSFLAGDGIDYNSSRKYNNSDNIRNIDWSSSARMNEPFVKNLQENKRLRIYILYDVSCSLQVRNKDITRQKYLARLAKLFALFALQNNDLLGFIEFDQKVNTFIKAGNNHRKIIDLITEKSSLCKETNLSLAINHLLQHEKKQFFVLLFSDLIGMKLDACKLLNEKLAFYFEDEIQGDLKLNINLEDSESNKFSSLSLKDLQQEIQLFNDTRKQEFATYRIDNIKLSLEDTGFNNVISFFRNRK